MLQDPANVIQEGLNELNKGYPVSSGAGIVNDPMLRRNELLAKALMLEQLKEQGFDAAFPVVEPTITEKMAILNEQGIPTVTPETQLRDKLSELNLSDEMIDKIIAQQLQDPSMKQTMNDFTKQKHFDALREVGVSEETISALIAEQQSQTRSISTRPSQDDETYQQNTLTQDGDFFAPTPGYYTGYYANMAIFIPEGYMINRQKTTGAWDKYHKSIKMRYIIINPTQYTGIAGNNLPFGKDVEGMVDYYMSIRKNLAFPNQTQYKQCKKSFQWIGIDDYNFNGYGMRKGRMDPYGKCNLNKKSKSRELVVLSGLKDPVRICGGERSKGPPLWSDKGFSKWGDDTGKAIQDLGNEIADAIGNWLKDMGDFFS